MTNEITFDTNTGEIKDSTPRDSSLNKYIGIEVKHLSDCVTKDQVLEYTKQVDIHSLKRTKVDYPLLLEYLKTIKPKTLELLTYLCENVFAWNFYDGCTKNIEKSTGIANVARELKSLIDLGLVRVVKRGNISKTDILIKVTPTLVFKGGYYFKYMSIERWYLSK